MLLIFKKKSEISNEISIYQYTKYRSIFLRWGIAFIVYTLQITILTVLSTFYSDLFQVPFIVLGYILGIHLDLFNQMGRLWVQSQVLVPIMIKKVISDWCEIYSSHGWQNENSLSSHDSNKRWSLEFYEGYWLW